jgi:hypothetical protein
MAKNHGARQQKKLAKQKAKRAEKRSHLVQRDSKDPTIRLRTAEKWPIVQALVGEDLWKDGIGYLVIARQEAEGRFIFAFFLVDVYCLGVKNTFWEAGSPGDFKEYVHKLESTQSMVSTDPACLAKIIRGAVEYALSFGFHPHPDFRHTAMLLEGIDPAACSREFTFGRDGKPFYIQGPNETFEQARAIMERIQAAGGHYMIEVGGSELEELVDVDDEPEYDPLALPEP